MQEPESKLVTACEYCRFRRIRCNGEMPCASCIARDRECQYPKSPPKKRGPKTKHEKARLAALLSSVADSGAAEEWPDEADTEDGSGRQRSELSHASSRRPRIKSIQSTSGKASLSEVDGGFRDMPPVSAPLAQEAAASSTTGSRASLKQQQADAPGRPQTTRKRASESRGGSTQGSEQSSVRIPTLALPQHVTSGVGKSAASMAGVRQQRNSEKSLASGDENSFNLGAVTFRTPRSRHAEESVLFPSPSERDMKAIAGFFAHVFCGLPVSFVGLFQGSLCCDTLRARVTALPCAGSECRRFLCRACSLGRW